MENKLSDRLPKILFIFALLTTAYTYGFVTEVYRVFPYSHIHNALNFAFGLKNKGEKNWWHKATNEKSIVPRYNSNAAFIGPTLITYINNNNVPGAKLIDMNGEIIHEWTLDWFRIWPSAKHLSSEDVPKEKPGTHIHGALLLENGDLIFNFESLGLVRVDKNGNVIWKLAYKTHHSIFQDESDDLWVSGEIKHQKPKAEYPNLIPPFLEPTILKVSLEGKVLREISVFDILKKNDQMGLLYAPTTSNFNVKLSGDILHLNDVEIFPQSMREGVFRHGDILISLRNVNAILILDPNTLKIKYKSTGGFVRQHDPDFISGNEFSIFDNNNIAPDSSGVYSRILVEDARTGNRTVYFEKQLPFYTKILGKHQWLLNGNLLITDSLNGRAIEYSKDAGIVWEFVNIIDEGKISIIEEATRLPKVVDVFASR